ncbi:MAG TPA: oligopeptide/dipeptide ABC transporter ATP-binding protein, partial [Burkholderiales bacterium]
VPSRSRRGEPLRQIPGMTPSLLELGPGCAFRERCARADSACRLDPELSAPVPGRQVRCFHPLTQGAAA